MLVYRNATHFSVNFATCNFIKFIDEPLSKQYGTHHIKKNKILRNKVT